MTIESHFRIADIIYGKRNACITAQVPLFFRSIRHLKKKRFRKAAECFTRVIERDPQHALALANRGVAFTNQGRPDLAIDDLKAALPLLKKSSRVEHVAGLLRKAEKSLGISRKPAGPVRTYKEDERSVWQSVPPRRFW